MWLSIFVYFKMIEGHKDMDLYRDYNFVVGRNGEYCYVSGHHRKDLDIVWSFSTLRECEKYLSLYNKDDYK